MKTRGRPGMLAPIYQELQVDRSEIFDTSLTCATHSSSCACAGSMVVAPISRICAMQSAIQSTCCSIAWIMLANTDGPARSRDGEEVREADGRDAEIGAGACVPFLGKRLATATGDADPVERSCHRRKAGRADDGVERIFLSVHFDAIRRKTFDRCLRHVDQLYVWKIVGFEIAGIDAEAFAAEH